MTYDGSWMSKRTRAADNNYQYKPSDPKQKHHSLLSFMSLPLNGLVFALSSINSAFISCWFTFNFLLVGNQELTLLAGPIGPPCPHHYFSSIFVLFFFLKVCYFYFSFILLISFKCQTILSLIVF